MRGLLSPSPMGNLAHDKFYCRAGTLTATFGPDKSGSVWKFL